MGAMQKTMRFQTPESTHWVIKNYAEGTNLFIRYLASVGPDNPFKESLVICMVFQRSDFGSKKQYPLRHQQMTNQIPSNLP